MRNAPPTIRTLLEAITLRNLDLPSAEAGILSDSEPAGLGSDLLGTLQSPTEWCVFCFTITEQSLEKYSMHGISTGQFQPFV